MRGAYTFKTLINAIDTSNMCKVNFFEQSISNELLELNGIFVIFKMNREVKHQISYAYNTLTTIHESKMFQILLFAFKVSTAFIC